MFRKLHLHTGEFAKLGTLIELPTEYFVTRVKNFLKKEKAKFKNIYLCRGKLRRDLSLTFQRVLQCRIICH